MSSPSTSNKYNFYCPVLGQDKEKNKISNLIDFLTDIKLMLKEFNIASNLLEPTYEYSGKKGNKYRVRLCIDSNSQNLINLFSKVGYEYNIKKQQLSNLAVAYLKQKLLIVNKREAIAKQAKQMHVNGASRNEICKLLTDFDINERFIERSIWDGRKTSSRIAFNFESFDEFVKTNEKLFGKTGFCLDIVDSIKIKNRLETVYDFTMSHKSHNFVANNILVSNCGVRLLTSNTNEKEIEKNKKQILNELFKAIPSGVGIDNKEKLSKEEFFDLIKNGIDWAIKNKYATKKDKECIEDYGVLDSSEKYLSQRAIARGLSQIGTLGSGNHFLEVQVVDEVFDKDLAKKWNLEKGSITIMIHTGSRGFGHQVATDFIKVFLDAKNKYNLSYPDAQLACVPINSIEGQKYLSSMNCAANFAYVNRQMISFKAREIFKKYNIDLDLLYDVAHNIAKKEQYKINGKLTDVLVHRKGATRAFSKGNKLLPKKYIKTGQPVILPGSMGTCSYVLVGDKAEELSFGSVSHGAGRIMSRSSALKNLTYEQVLDELTKNKIEIKTQTQKGIVEESPESYKDVDEVVKVLKANELAKPVVKLKPIMVMKG
jgi:tRNA-splicing ligase RtcB